MRPIIQAPGKDAAYYQRAAAEIGQHLSGSSRQTMAKPGTRRHKGKTNPDVSTSVGTIIKRQPLAIMS
jgi:hypothetical protein